MVCKRHRSCISLLGELKVTKICEWLVKYVSNTILPVIGAASFNQYETWMECQNAPVGPAFLAHTKQKVSNIVDLTVLRLAFFMGYE